MPAPSRGFLPHSAAEQERSARDTDVAARAQSLHDDASAKSDRGNGAPTPLRQIGSLETRLARSAAEIQEAQKLRYHVFYTERSAPAPIATSQARRDMDPFDPICDHLLVFDHGDCADAPTRRAPVVGTCRLLLQAVAERHQGFYSASEFDVPGLVARHPSLRFLELGRSCVLAPYRNKRTVELLWHGISEYVMRHRVDVMMGCASLEGTDPAQFTLALSFLHHFARAPEQWRTRALAPRYVDMNLMPKDAIDPRVALRALPPLLKGYLRLGAFIGDGAVIDDQFGTTDVFIVLPLSAIKLRYYAHFNVTPPASVVE